VVTAVLVDVRDGFWRAADDLNGHPDQCHMLMRTPKAAVRCST
jgi:hypothetical protein